MDDEGTEMESRNQKKRKKSKSNSLTSILNKNKKRNRKWFLIYPDNNCKDRWDFLITLLLIVSCV